MVLCTSDYYLITTDRSSSSSSSLSSSFSVCCSVMFGSLQSARQSYLKHFLIFLIFFFCTVKQLKQNPPARDNVLAARFFLKWLLCHNECKICEIKNKKKEYECNWSSIFISSFLSLTLNLTNNIHDIISLKKKKKKIADAMFYHGNDVMPIFEHSRQNEIMNLESKETFSSQNCPGLEILIHFLFVSLSLSISKICNSSLSFLLSLPDLFLTLKVQN